MNVYRVETKDEVWPGLHRGPYTIDGDYTPGQDKLAHRLADAHRWDDTRPTLMWDWFVHRGIDPYRGSARLAVIELKPYLCAFSSLFDAERWFEGFEHDLKRNGYVLRKYEVPDDAAIKLQHQVAVRGAALRKAEGTEVDW